MKRLIPVIALGWVICLSAWGQVRSISSEEFRRLIFDYQNNTEWNYQGKKPCVVDFYTTWCGPCKRLAPVMDSLSVVYKGKVQFYKVDTEQNREVAMYFRINSIPQVLYVPKTGNPALLKGLYPTQNIEQIINEFLLGKKPRKD